MKRVILFATGFLIILALIFVPAFKSSVKYTDDSPYEFELTPGTDEWRSYSKSSILAKLQVPEEKLSSMTTGALLETVLNYPYLLDYNAFGKLQYACDTFCKDFNGFKELMQREDLTEELIEKYGEISEMTKEQLSEEALGASAKESGNYFITSTMEFLLFCDEMQNGSFSGKELRAIDELREKAKQNGTYVGLPAEVYS